MIQSLRITLIISILISIVSSRIPSLAEISKMHDPVLIQIFRDSKIDLTGMSRYNEEPPPIPSTSNGEVSINHESALGSSSSSSSINQGFESGIGKLAADGANVFYRGAQTVGNAFGIRGGNYNIPLLDTAASFIG